LPKVSGGGGGGGEGVFFCQRGVCNFLGVVPNFETIVLYITFSLLYDGYYMSRAEISLKLSICFNLFLNTLKKHYKMFNIKKMIHILHFVPELAR
jgi:hypothetical protein